MINTRQINDATLLMDLGAPALADDNLIVTITNMKNGTYTIAAQPDVTRNVTATVATVDVADTMGTLTVLGHNKKGDVISEVLNPVSGATVTGVKAFTDITSITGADWIIGGTTEDTIIIGTGNELGLDRPLSATSKVKCGYLGTTFMTGASCLPTVAGTPTIEETTVDLSGSTYDGAKIALIFVVD